MVELLFWVLLKEATHLATSEKENKYSTSAAWVTEADPNKKKAPGGKSLTKSPFCRRPISAPLDVARPQLVRVVISSRAREISCCPALNDVGRVTRWIVSQHVENQQSQPAEPASRATPWGHARSFGAVACFLPFIYSCQWGGRRLHNACGYYSGLDLLNSELNS